MKGLHLGIDGTFIEKVCQDAGELMLLAKGDGVEVMMQEIAADRHFYITPSEGVETLEFFYMLEGSLICETDGCTTKLIKGQYFYSTNLNQVAYFKSIERCRLLYVSTQPVFKYISSRLQELINMVEAVEKKDTCTLNHTKRLQDYSLRIAERLRFSKERLIALGYAALLHDVGKVYIPTEVLMKPGSLTDGEFDLVKKHPVDGRDLVEETFLRSIGTIIEQHHERLDGSGYPYGLKGDDILLEARIVAVVDSYDAMISDRPYRKGRSPELAVVELLNLSGRQYDKMVVQTLVSVLIDDGVLNSDSNLAGVNHERGYTD